MVAINQESKLAQCIFDGYIKDIKEAFHQIYNRVPNFSDSEILVSSLHTIINSYYFENLYQYSKLGIDENNQYFLSVIPNKNIEKKSLDIDGQEILITDYTKKILGESRRRMPLNNELPISAFKQFVDFGIGQVMPANIDEIFISDFSDILPVIVQLKKNNPSLYNVIFEESDLKQNLILKNKKDLEFDVVPVDKIETYFKDNLKIQSVENAYELLNTNYDLRYLVKQTHKKDSPNFIIVARNDFEIAGVSVVDQSNDMINSLKTVNGKNMGELFMKVSSIMVSKNYRGQGLGVQLFETAINEAKKQDYILIRSEASDLGRNYLKSNIDNIANSKQVPVINSEWFEILKPLLPKIFNNSYESGKDTLLNVLDEMRIFEKSIHEKKMNARSGSDFFAIEDEQQDFFKKLSSRYNTKRNNNIKL